MKKIIIIFILLFTISSCWKTIDDNLTEIKMENNNFIEQSFAQISVSDFKNEIENEEVILLDVRTLGELPKYGKIRGNQILIDINLSSFASEIWKLDKSKKYLVYCWHGNRSVVARDFMKREWFMYVKDLEWWIDKWVSEWESIIK